MPSLRADQAQDRFNRFPRRSLFLRMLIHGRATDRQNICQKTLRLEKPRYPLFDTLYLGLARETRDYLRATREQFIAARKITRMDVGR
jgi:hypothetical protein